MIEVDTRGLMSAFDDWVKQTNKDAEKAFRAMCLQLFAGIVVRTPVDTGRLRGNWQISLNNPVAGDLDRTANPTAEERSKLDAANLGTSVYLHNNLPYAERIEFYNHSQQSPNGMVRVTLTEFEQALRRAAQEASR